MTNPTQLTCLQSSQLIQPFVRRHSITLMAAVAIASAWMLINDQPGWLALVLIATGTMAPIIAWAHQSSPGFPITAMMGAQALVIYATPIVTQNESIFVFPIDRINGAAFEIFVFGMSMWLGSAFMVGQVRPRIPTHYRAFKILKSGSSAKLANVGMLMMSIGIGFHVFNLLGGFRMLPSGVFPIARTLSDAVGLGGGLVSAYLIGWGATRGPRVVIFWILYGLFTVFMISNYTLFPATGMMMSVSLGLFLGRGKLPLMFLAIFISILAFLNLSKFEMRELYWLEGQAYAPQTIDQLPERYTEWVGRSLAQLTGSTALVDDWDEDKSQQLSDRVNSLIILLNAQRYIVDDKIPTLGGATYTIIPPLFIPRIFWANKPRTHEGMVMLNIHFGQQTREESLVTYISWGFLPEAYANFGPFFGAMVLGLVLGAALGWIEQKYRFHPLTSLESLIVLTFAVNCASSFESVSSIWLTSVFQMIVALGGGLWILTHSQRLIPTR